MKYTLSMFLVFPLGFVLRSLPGSAGGGLWLKHAFSMLGGVAITQVHAFCDPYYTSFLPAFVSALACSMLCSCGWYQCYTHTLPHSLTLSLQWVFRAAWVHTFVSSTGTYLICCLAPRKSAGDVAFVWMMVYMTVSHMYRMYVAFDIPEMDFTMMQMVLTMKMTGFAYNYSDGSKAAQATIAAAIRPASKNRPAVVNYNAQVCLCSTRLCVCVSVHVCLCVYLSVCVCLHITLTEPHPYATPHAVRQVLARAAAVPASLLWVHVLLHLHPGGARLRVRRLLLRARGHPCAKSVCRRHRQ